MDKDKNKKDENGQDQEEKKIKMDVDAENDTEGNPPVVVPATTPTTTTADVKTSLTESVPKPSEAEEGSNGKVSPVPAAELQSLNPTTVPADIVEPSLVPSPIPAAASPSEGEESTSTIPVVEEELVELKIIFNKKPYYINISLEKTVGDLKKLIEVSTQVPPALQKVLVKGANNDQVTLKSIGLANKSKFLVIGSSLYDVMAVSKPPEAEVASTSEEANGSGKDSQNWCSLPQHRKIVDKGLPEDAMVGISNERDPLPPFPLHGMLSSKGSKVRLTFKLESDELWIGTKERTDKIGISTIRNVVSQKITGFEHYHILAIQLGPTEASRFYVYWVPAQYIEAIKELLGG